MRTIRTRHCAVTISLFMSAALWLTATDHHPARATVGGSYTVPLPNAPAITVTYGDDTERTPDTLNRTYDAAPVRNAKMIFSYTADVEVVARSGASATCSDADANYFITVALGPTSAATITAEYERWDPVANTWSSTRTQLFNTVDHVVLEPYTATVQVCGQAAELETAPTPTASPEPTPSPSPSPTPSPLPEPTPLPTTTRTAEPTPAETLSPQPTPAPPSRPKKRVHDKHDEPGKPRQGR